MHLIKLAVGIDSPAHLKDRQARFCAMRWQGQDVYYHITRQYPQKANDIMRQGSLYWVIKGAITLRQSVLGIDKVTDDAGQTMTAILLAPDHVPVRLTPRRPFQGWRYLPPEDAPPDLNHDDQSLDPVLMRELNALGLA